MIKHCGKALLKFDRLFPSPIASPIRRCESLLAALVLETPEQLPAASKMRSSPPPSLETAIDGKVLFPAKKCEDFYTRLTLLTLLTVLVCGCRS